MNNEPRCLHHLGLYLPWDQSAGLPARIMDDHGNARPVHAQSGDPSDFNSQTIWAVNEATCETLSELYQLFGD